MAKKAAKKAVDTGQVQVPEQGTGVSENENLSADTQQEEHAEEMPDARVQQVQQSSPAPEMKVPEIMNLLEETQEGSVENANAGVQQDQQSSPGYGMKASEIMHLLKETQEGSGAAADAGMQQPFPDPEDDQQKEQTERSGRQNVPTFMITCRNKISKVIGGVSFVNGVGCTSDGFTASWFGNKDGYEVREAGS